MSENSPSRTALSRRRFLKRTAVIAGGAVLGSGAALLLKSPKPSSQKPAARVAILRAASYERDLVKTIRAGLDHFPNVIERARGHRVLLKPNLVEYSNARRINTNPSVVAAAVEVFRSVGAKEVVVAEGPGHQRDTEMLLEESGLDYALNHLRTSFVDLNLDAISPVNLAANYTRLNRLFLPHTVLGADLVVSLAKMKTHHWVGVTLSLKNFLGVVPGVKYGWPKNVLHWRGIEHSIMDVNVAVRGGFAIIDGIEAMEGDGPLRGEMVPSGVLIMGDNLPAVDATAARAMSVSPERVGYIQAMTLHGGVVREDLIEQIGEPIASVRRKFKLLPEFERLRLIA